MRQQSVIAASVLRDLHTRCLILKPIKLHRLMRQSHKHPFRFVIVVVRLTMQFFICDNKKSTPTSKAGKYNHGSFPLWLTSTPFTINDFIADKN